jgi:peptide/nickel transport system permease protein
MIGATGMALSVAVGGALGGVAGYRGGTLDRVLMRAVDAGLAFPALFAILILTALLPPGAAALVGLIGLTGWMPVARLVRGSVREVTGTPFVDAALALGAPGWRILGWHVAPHCAAVLGVAALVQFNRAILTEASISFLGFGLQPPAPSLGNLLTGAQDYAYTAPWLALAPGLVLALTLLLLHALGRRRLDASSS